MPIRLQNHGDDDEGDEARIEIIPLIDIMFFLLASFMLVSLSMAHIVRVPVKVPVASSGEPEKSVPPVFVVIDARGVVYLGTEPVPVSDLARRLQAAGGGGERVLISADGQSRHADVLRVVDALRAAGITRIGFESREGKSP